jgi:hypothetical protein
MVYTGKAVEPVPTVKTKTGERLFKDTDFTVSYENNREIGTATVILKGIEGKCTGVVEKTFLINPRAVELASLKAGKKQLTVKWKKGKNISGYQLEYSKSKNFTDSKKVTISNYTTKSKVIKKLEAKKRYYVRIRTYKKVGGVKYYSKWSDPLSAKTKK